MLPEAFIQNMRAQFPDEADALFDALDQPYAAALRLNTLRGDIKDTVSAFTGDAVPWCASGRYIRPDTRPGLSPLQSAGAFYIQEASAMAPAEALNVQPGEIVLDLCAAPGGKSSQLAAALNGKGLLVSCEPDASRAQILSSTLERLGVVNAVVINAYPDAVARALPGFFDAVLVDAPCSGEGMFRRDLDSRTAWLEGSPAGCAARQAGILDQAALLVKNGGRLVYSTCTYDKGENEDNISAFLERHPEFDYEDFALNGLGVSQNGCLRVWPHKARGDGQFAARLRKKKGDVTALRCAPLPRLDKETLKYVSLLEEMVPGLTLSKERIERRGGTLALLPQSLPVLTGLRVLRAGLKLGRIGRGYVEPDHALAMALKSDQAALTFEADEEQALHLLAGETANAPGRGWTLITHHALPLGWGKVSGGTLKNHIPKGLRRPLRYE